MIKVRHSLNAKAIRDNLEDMRGLELYSTATSAEVRRSREAGLGFPREVTWKTPDSFQALVRYENSYQPFLMGY